MLNFKPVTIQDKALVEAYTAKRNFHLCEHCFTDLFIWEGHYNTEICVFDGFLLIKMESFPDHTPMYLAPVGQGDLLAALTALEKDAEERAIPFVMTSISEVLKDEILALDPDRYVFENLVNGADYIYSAESMITLKGKKLQSKRNFINRFQNAFQDRWRYQEITPDMTNEVFQYHLHWCEQNGCEADESFRGETCAIRRALDNFEALGLSGGCLRLDENIIAFTLGCRASEDMWVIQIEKAEADIPGSYPMINQQFAMRHCQDTLYINREEDLGLPGLRKAKQSYQPVMMGSKFMAMRNV